MSKYECKKKKKTKKKTWSMRKPREIMAVRRVAMQNETSPLAANLTTDPIGDEHVSLEKNEGKTRGG